MFDIIVGVFSVLGSIASIVSVGVAISIKNSIKIKGDKNDTKNTIQISRGKNNFNSNTVNNN